MVLSESGILTSTLKRYFKDCFLKSLKYYDYLSPYFNRGEGDYYDEGFKHLKIVEKAGLRAETRRKGHPETPHCLHVNCWEVEALARDHILQV